jgi:hypothetical protein
VKVFIELIGGARDSNEVHYRLRLEQDVQSSMERFLSHLPDKDTPFPPPMGALLNAGWFHGMATHGRKARFRLETVGEVRQINAARAEEVDELIGSGKTLETFIKAFSRQEPLQLAND